MADKLVDTNVLIVGSAPAFADVTVGADDIEKVVEWLTAFRNDSSRKLVLDEAFKIYEEYRNKLNDQHLGLQVIHEKMAHGRLVPVEYDPAGYGVVPVGLAKVDNSDKKFAAAALHDPAGIKIVNATDSDWAERKTELDAHGIQVVELLK